MTNELEQQRLTSQSTSMQSFTDYVPCELLVKVTDEIVVGILGMARTCDQGGELGLAMPP